MSTATYDLVVVGAGLIGSSCAKYASSILADGAAAAKGRTVALVGPTEDQTETFHGAWFDEGRIATKFTEKPHWQHLALRSIERYRQIERDSSVAFFEECGFLCVSTSDDPSSVQEVHDIAKSIHALGHPCDPIDPEVDFAPVINFPTNCVGYFERSVSGHISPRRLVRAQQLLARGTGRCDVINDGVRLLRTKGEGEEEEGFSLTLEKEGRVISARQVVVACGAYVNFLDSIETFAPSGSNGWQLDISLKQQTVAYLEVSVRQLESSPTLKSLPAMSTTYASDILDAVYILPPILYPDGKYYLKIGHQDAFENDVNTFEEVTDWYKNHKGGNPEAVKELARFARELFPTMEVLSVHGRGCITANTPDKVAPFIDEIAKNLFVAVGGCGYGAKSSDEIGRIAAHLAVKGEWTTSIPREAMKAKWRKRM